ncbi:MAG: hypothetical protein M0D53_08105 [Flavobacterium sp. JAD_PAG50586_2]|nr:MAG: hypothetical protein M0D53_08105 [Flavobacterium sp. JAD_PAG50586_2]
MKRKLLLSNALMGLMILFAIVSQSIHSIEHLAEQFSEKMPPHLSPPYRTASWTRWFRKMFCL